MLKLGRKPRGYDPRIPHMSALLRKAPFIPLPDSVDYASKLPENTGVMLNDNLGCCTVSAYYHAIQVWSSWTNPDGLVITEPDLNILRMYEESCGYDPTKPDSDRGGVEQDILRYLLRTGAPTGFKAETRHVLRGFFEIDVRHLWDIKRAIYESGLVYIGFDIPQNIMSVGEPPKLWDVGGDEIILGGHAIILTGWDAVGFHLISWGKKYRMTYEFFSRFTEEVYALCDIDWIQGTGESLLGMTMAELKVQMRALTK